MAFQVEAAAARTVHLEVKWGKQPIKLEYHGGEKFRAIEKEAEAEMEKAQKAFKKREKARKEAEAEGREYEEPEEDFDPSETRRETCEFLAKILAKWDVTVGGEMVPLEASALFDLPLETAFFIFLRDKIATDLQNGGKGGKAHS